MEVGHAVDRAVTIHPRNFEPPRANAQTEITTIIFIITNHTVPNEIVFSLLFEKTLKCRLQLQESRAQVGAMFVQRVVPLRTHPNWLFWTASSKGWDDLKEATRAAWGPIPFRGIAASSPQLRADAALLQLLPGPDPGRAAVGIYLTCDASPAVRADGRLLRWCLSPDRRRAEWTARRRAVHAVRAVLQQRGERGNRCGQVRLPLPAHSR